MVNSHELPAAGSRDHGWGRRPGTRCHSVYLIKKINESDCGLFSETFERGKWLVEKWLQLAGRSHREMYTKLHSQRHTWSSLWVHSPPLPPPTWPFAPRGAEVFIVDPSLIDKRTGVASPAIKRFSICWAPECKASVFFMNYVISFEYAFYLFKYNFRCKTNK